MQRSSAQALVSATVLAGCLFALGGGCSRDETESRPPYTPTTSTTTGTTTTDTTNTTTTDTTNTTTTDTTFTTTTTGTGGSGLEGGGGSSAGGGGSGPADPYCPATPTISEYLPNPPGNDDNNEFIEIAVANGAAMSNVAVLHVKGDSGGTMGNVLSVVDLNGVTSGSNCVVLITEGSDPYTPGDFTEINVALADLELQNASHSLLLVDYTGHSLPTLNQDLDTDNDGVLDAPVPFTVLDAITVDDDSNPADAQYVTNFHLYDRATALFTLQGFTLSQSLGAVAGGVFDSPPLEYASQNLDLVDPDAAAGYDLSPGAPNP